MFNSRRTATNRNRSVPTQKRYTRFLSLALIRFPFLFIKYSSPFKKTGSRLWLPVHRYYLFSLVCSIDLTVTPSPNERLIIAENLFIISATCSSERECFFKSSGVNCFVKALKIISLYFPKNWTSSPVKICFSSF